MLGELKIEPISVEGSCICFIDTGLNEEKVRAQFLSRGHKFSIPENFPSIRDFTSTMHLHFRSDLVGVALVWERSLHLADARPFGRLKAPLGLSLLRYAAQTRACLGRRNRLISSAKKIRAFPTRNALLYISLSYVDLIASFTSIAILNNLFAICNSRLLPTNQIANCDGRVRPIQGRILFFILSSIF